MTTDLSKHLCTDCLLGYYSSSSNSTCSKCPNKLMTPSTGSTSRSNCSQCSPNYCHYGTCTVALQGPAPSCTCHFGFTKDNEGLCTVPAYYIAAIGFLVGILLIVLVVVLMAKSRKAKKEHNSVVRIKDSEINRRQMIVTYQNNEIAQLNNTWTINSREVKLRKRIDKDYPGVYGEVYEAEYREIVVAVKKLQKEHLPINRLYLEFAREIEVMKTIRHPNIVWFLGAGRHHDDDCPFLVVEYMPRGSLTKILSNQEIVLDDNMKLRFAIDAAKGMRFLHSQRPPRIHRDLKSANLLVSTRWVVKVADFGTARLVRDEGVNQEAVRGEGFLDLTAPLLRPEYHLSSGVGTPFWCAPEIWRGSGYGTPADVYSFGIVMWEICSRKIPYYDQICDHLMTAIMNGTRPTVPENDQNDYIQLMKACWSGNVNCRPTFKDIVLNLEEMSEKSISIEILHHEN
ncbi:probable serine/threonine-protein kinase drkA [Corticium candelabrum]|uniref:probable serine/threonine-protein kinase drkA n=1 Tax=Corticium candelabrum TaxID=121492 RepID=UPI002E253DCE|nr:probable serine/threonine-protein kinase drkA [Corticium candelabrum]